MTKLPTDKNASHFHKEKEIEKPRGWANLQQQLKEVRDESFKQGVWAGQNSQRLPASQDTKPCEVLHKEKVLEMIEEVYNNLKEKEDDKLNEMPSEVSMHLQSGFLIGYADSLVKFRKELTQKIKGNPAGIQNPKGFCIGDEE